MQLPLQESNIRASSRLLALGVLITADAGVVAGPSCTASLTSHLLTSQCRWKLSVSRPQPNTEHWHGHGGHSTKHYNQLHYKQCYPSCGVLYRPVFCHMTPLLTSGWWWWDHRDLIIDVSAEVVWDLSTRDSCLKVGSCCPIYPYVWVMYYVLSRYFLTHWRNHLFNSM